MGNWQYDLWVQALAPQAKEKANRRYTQPVGADALGTRVAMGGGWPGGPFFGHLLGCGLVAPFKMGDALYTGCVGAFCGDGFRAGEKITLGRYSFGHPIPTGYQPRLPKTSRWPGRC